MKPGDSQMTEFIYQEEILPCLQLIGPRDRTDMLKKIDELMMDGTTPGPGLLSYACPLAFSLDTSLMPVP